MKLDVPRYRRPGDLVSMFPDGTVKPGEIEKAVEEHGTYHRLGKTVFMTDTDVRDFIDRLAGKRSQPIEPTDDEAGLIVYIGAPTTTNGEDTSVFVGWTPIGQELALLDRVRVGAQEHVMVLATENMSLGEVKAWKAKHKSSRFFGNWYKRDDEVMEVANKANASEGNYDE